MLAPSYNAEMFTDVVLDTATVLTENVALVFPPATLTVSGTVATEVLLLDRDTTTPPLGAGLLIVTVPVETSPPTTEDGVTDKETSDIKGGFTELSMVTYPL